MVTGRRHTGRPLGPPVKAFPILLPVSLSPCRSLRFVGPSAASSGSPPRLRGAERTSRCLRRPPPHVLDDPPLTCLTARQGRVY
jgi:hypothetical protein